MESVNQLLKLFMRQAHLERSTGRRAGARMAENQQVGNVKEKPCQLPQDARRAARVRDNDGT
jgi:hypothetical protein